MPSHLELESIILARLRNHQGRLTALEQATRPAPRKRAGGRKLPMPITPGSLMKMFDLLVALSKIVPHLLVAAAAIWKWVWPMLRSWWA